jgi:hypothetical protein
VPFVRIKRIVIDLNRRAKGLPAVGAAHKHHIGGASPGRYHAGQHVNVVVSRAAGVVNRQEQHSSESYSIYSAAAEIAAHVDGGDSIKSGCDIRVLRVARANAIEGVPFPAEKNIAVRVDIKASVNRPVGNSYGRLPGDSAVCGTLELHAVAAAVNTIVQLILKPMAHAVRLVDSEPFLVAATRLFVRLQFCPGLAAVG